MILRILAIEDPENERLQKLYEKAPQFLSEMRIEPIFAYGFPKDKLDELNRAQMELNMKLGSRREIMERMGKQNIPDLLDEIDEDMIRMGLLQTKITQMSSGMFGNGENPTEENGEQNENPTDEENQENEDEDTDIYENNEVEES